MSGIMITPPPRSAPSPPPGTVALATPRRRVADHDIVAAAANLDGADPLEIIDWATTTFGSGLCLTTSATDTVLIDLATRVVPDIEVVFVDTGFHFAETLWTLRQAMARHRLALTVLRAEPDAGDSERMADLWADGPEPCCAVRKSAPLDAHLAHRAAWLSGLRRADSPDRAATPVVERDRRGLVKINPIAHWSDDDVAAYIEARRLIVNPLVARGYPSIGCWPCTEPADGEDPRSGRWVGTARTECGIHL